MNDSSGLVRALGAIEVRQEDGAPIRLGELWRDEIAVLGFLRHFG